MKSGYGMSVRSMVICLIMVLAGSSMIRAGGEPPVGYMLSRTSSSLIVRPDLSALLSDDCITKLRNGLGLVLEYQLTLKVPRRFFGTRTAAEAGGAIQISYRVLTEDFVFRFPNRPGDSGRSAGNEQALSLFLADSLVVVLADPESPGTERTYRLDLQVTTIYLTDLNLLAGRDAADSASAPLEYLFRQFLDVTGYGRTEISYSSRPFRLTDVPVEP